MGLTPDEVRESHCNEWISEGLSSLCSLGRKDEGKWMKFRIKQTCDQQ